MTLITQLSGNSLEVARRLISANGRCTNLILEQGSSKGPDGGEGEVEFIEFLRAIWRRVLGGEQTLQKVTQHLDHALLRDGDDLLKPSHITSHHTGGMSTPL